MLQELEAQVVALYRKADAAVVEYQTVTGLACPDGCVQCCDSDKVEATILELVPLAFHLCQTNQAELLLKRLERLDKRARCILFRPDLAEPKSGGCSEYPYRALVCRLFGFAGNRDRSGTPRLAFCRVMKDAGGPPPRLCPPPDTMPLFHDFGLAITALQPALGTERLPINQALEYALHKVGLFLALENSLPTSCQEDNPNDKPFNRPQGRRLRAA